METKQEEIRTSLIEYSYAQASIALLGSAGSAVLVAGFIQRHGATRGLQTWLVGHALVTILGLWLVRRFRTGAFARSPDTALLLRRAATFAVGLLWCVAGLLWPLDQGNVGLGVLLCVSGLAAAASSTGAADPLLSVLFDLLAFLPPLVLAAPHDAWLSGLLTLYVVALTVIGFRNHRLLELSLSLRWTNTQLLAKAREDQQATLIEKQRAENAVEARNRFLAAASHDLRQPVQALSLFADVLAHQTNETKRAEVIASVGRASHALSAMLESLLDISRLDAGLSAPSPTEVPVLRLLDDIASGLAGEAEARNMVVQVAGRACDVWADRTMLARVVQNLAVNAVRHGDGRVLLSSRMRHDRCLVQVWDQGPGIAQADRERIFEELVQLKNRERERSKGLGLGLALVRRLCDLNQWKLSMRSEVSRGTVFSISIPLTEGRTSAVRNLRSVDSLAARVLFVEDDQDVREATITWLENKGCEVHSADRAEDALSCVSELRRAGKELDLLVTDFGLPGALSGAELALRVRGEHPELPVVIVTGAQALPFGGHPPPGIFVMRKPVKSDELWRTVCDALDSRALRPPDTLESAALEVGDTQHRERKARA